MDISSIGWYQNPIPIHRAISNEPGIGERVGVVSDVCSVPVSSARVVLIFHASSFSFFFHMREISQFNKTCIVGMYVESSYILLKECTLRPLLNNIHISLNSRTYIHTRTLTANCQLRTYWLCFKNGQWHMWLPITDWHRRESSVVIGMRTHQRLAPYKTQQFVIAHQFVIVWLAWMPLTLLVQLF